MINREFDHRFVDSKSKNGLKLDSFMMILEVEELKINNSKNAAGVDVYPFIKLKSLLLPID